MEVRVNKRESNQCPYCFIKMEPWTFLYTREMFKNEMCSRIWCHRCGEEYFYMENKDLPWGYAEKICHECDGVMYLDYLPGPDIYQDMCWYCTVCGIEELHSEFLSRTGRKM